MSSDRLTLSLTFKRPLDRLPGSRGVLFLDKPMDFIPEDITPRKPSQTDWDQIVATRQSKDLTTTKKVFIVPVFVFFLVYYFALPVMVGLAPRSNTWGAVAGLAFGVVSSIGLILVSPTFMGIDQPNVSGAARHLIQTKAWFPLEPPSILSIPPAECSGCWGFRVGTRPWSESSGELRRLRWAGRCP